MNGIIVNATGAMAITQERMNKQLADSISADTAVSCQCEDEKLLAVNDCGPNPRHDLAETRRDRGDTRLLQYGSLW